MSDPFALDDDLPEPETPQSAPEPPWLSSLNPEQRTAVETTEGPVLVLSGAGTGKTRVLTTRLAHIMSQRMAQPWQILAVTFTNRAAREMRDRVEAMVGGVAEAIWLGTFHALGLRILRRHGELVGLKSNFTILDTDDQIRLLKQVMEAEDVDHKKWPAQALMHIIQRWKDRGQTPDMVSNADAGEAAGGRAVELYKLYQERLVTLNAADFGDLLLHCLTIFKAHPDVLAEYQRRFHYILVDEYQDTNVAQYLWLRLLAQQHRNLCCVGDDDQSIYSWRGAEVGNILKFESDFPDAQVVRLERNYRSTPVILNAASSLIANNQGRLGKTLKAAGAGLDIGAEPITVRGVWDGEDEARWLIEEVEARQVKGEPLNQMAILVRAGFQMLAFEERLVTTGVPYRVVGGPRFYERREIRDALAYLRIIIQPEDDLAFERIVNVPKRGIGDATVQKMHVLGRATNMSLLSAAEELCETDEVRPQARRAISRLVADIQRWASMAETVPAAELAAMVLDESGYTAMWQADKAPDSPGRLENLKELVGVLEDWDTLSAFLEHVSLVMENDNNASQDGITLMTLHAAKGLEFDTVFLPGWEEEVFPHRRALEETGDKGLEEERRLAYVGLTRARKKVFVSHAANRRIYNQWQSAIPSRFVDELPKELTEVINDAGGYGGQSAGGSDLWDTSAPMFQARPNKRHLNQTIEGESWVVEKRGLSHDLAVGERVFHQKFGYGTIADMDGDRLEIRFEKTGTKRVLASFVEPA